MQIYGLSLKQTELSLGILLWVSEESLCKRTFYHFQKDFNKVKLIRQPYPKSIKDIRNLKSKEAVWRIGGFGCKNRDEDHRRTRQTKGWQEGLKRKEQCQAYWAGQWAEAKDKQSQRTGDWVNHEKQQEESRRLQIKWNKIDEEEWIIAWLWVRPKFDICCNIKDGEITW